MLKNDFMVFYSDIKKIFLKSKINRYFLDFYNKSDLDIEVILNLIEPNLEQEGFFVGLNSDIFLLNCDKKNLVRQNFIGS